MTIFKDYKENGKLIGTRIEPVTEKNFERYLEEHGAEKAAGYLDALSDIMKELDEIVIWRQEPPLKGRSINTYAMIKRGLSKFFEAKNTLFEQEQVKALLDKNDSPNYIPVHLRR